MRLKVIRSSEAREYLQAIAWLRITVFQEWPYLYQGSLEYERTYLENYFRSQSGVVILAYDCDALAGVSTAVPLVDAAHEIRAPIQDAGLSASSIFYFGESLLLPKYRGQGLGKLFFDLREEWALRIPGISSTCFCSVVRNSESSDTQNHADPQPLWRSRGYAKASNIIGQFSWPDLGSEIETTKPMQFWLKEWSPRETALKIIQAYYRAFNDLSCDLNHDSILALLSDQVVHDINQGAREIGKPAFAKFLKSMNEQYKEHLSDFTLFANDAGSLGAAEFTCSGEYLKSAPGLPAAHGQKYTLPVGAFFELADRKIARVSNFYNAAEWIRQVTQ
jgi:steroid delta-isomerase-like uncharacterized protein